MCFIMISYCSDPQEVGTSMSARSGNQYKTMEMSTEREITTDGTTQLVQLLVKNMRQQDEADATRED